MAESTGGARDGGGGTGRDGGGTGRDGGDGGGTGRGGGGTGRDGGGAGRDGGGGPGHDGGEGFGGLARIGTEDELRELVGPANPVVFAKAASELGELERRWLAHSPLCLIATSGADGRCDVSPKGDPPGFALVLDPRTIALPDRPGNRRLDSWRNVLANPHVGLLFMIPGRGDTLRINGRAALLRDAPFFEQMVVRGHRPRIALLVDVEECYFHCAKSFLRARLWETGSWRPEAVPSRASIAQATEWTERSLAELEERYGPAYGRQLYGD